MLLACAILCLAVILLHGLAPTWWTSRAWALEFSASVMELLGKIWWGVALGAVAVGVLSFVPREWTAIVLSGRSRGSGLLRAVGLGLLFDLCSHGILMIGAKLYERGATLGQTLAFLLASPWNSFSLTLILFGLIGWPWTLAFIAASAGVALATGWIADEGIARGWLPPNPNQPSPGNGPPIMFPRDLFRALRGLRWSPSLVLRVLRAGVTESRMVVRWMLFGVLLASVVRTFVSQDHWSDWFGPTAAGLLLTMLATTFIEVCSEGSSPIAGDLLQRAGAPGNAFVFLMGGVATDATELLVLRETTRSWKLALALPLISVPQVLVLGWLANRFAG